MIVCATRNTDPSLPPLVCRLDNDTEVCRYEVDGPWYDYTPNLGVSREPLPVDRCREIDAMLAEAVMKFTASQSTCAFCGAASGLHVSVDGKGSRVNMCGECWESAARMLRIKHGKGAKQP